MDFGDKSKWTGLGPPEIFREAPQSMHTKQQAKMKGEKFSCCCCCCFPIVLHGASPRCRQASLEGMLGSILPSCGSSELKHLYVITKTRCPERAKPKKRFPLSWLQIDPWKVCSRAGYNPELPGTCPCAAAGAHQWWNLKQRLRR